MKGQMQDFPLELGMVIRRAETLNARKTVATRTHEGVEVLSFGQVADRARRLAAALRALGVRQDDRVATFAWNHHQHVEAYLGVPLLGAILHTLNIRLFEADLAYIVEHAGDKVVIVDKSLLPVWEKVRARVSCVEKTIVIDDAPGTRPEGTVDQGASPPEPPSMRHGPADDRNASLRAASHRPGPWLDYEELLAGHPPTFDLPVLPEDQAAAICYTSGTTGRPKGVVFTHRSNVLHALMATGCDTLALSRRETVLPIVPMFHANAWGIPYGCLLAGASLVLPGRFMVPDILVELIVSQKVTFAAGVPSIWVAMLEPLRKARARLGALERIGCGGSAVPPALQRAYQEGVGVPILQAWGMTETSPLASANSLASVRDASPSELEAIHLSAGRLVAGVEARIVDDAGKELPWDGTTVGELQVRGPWIASGYWRDGAPPEKFVDGWLRTGDVAAIDAGGAIRITDRTKDLIKSGGEWISSVEVEGHLMAHPGVAEACVVAVPHPRWCERPLACVVARTRGGLTREELLDWLRPRIAKWWLPDDVVFIDEVPKTSVGKFDKKVLRERFKSHTLGA